MKPEIRKIVTRSALFLGILAVSIAGMQLAVLRNEQNAPNAVTVSTVQSPVIQLCASSLPTRTRDFHPLEFAHVGQTKLRSQRL